MSCDFHTHSIYSDGSKTPDELVLEAKMLNLYAIALTDHNTTGGVDEFLKVAEKYGVNAIGGVELSTDYLGSELHILGLFLEKHHYSIISEITDDLVLAKKKSNITLCKNLQERGFDIDYDEISFGKKQINRAHIAKALVAKGYVSSTDEAFNTILSKEYGLYFPPKLKNSLDVIKQLRDCGIVTILAHPLLNISMGELAEFLPIAKNMGLCGMEAYYTRFSNEQTNNLIKLCNKYSLVASGGSDYHGDIKPNVRLSKGFGDLIVPDDVYDNLLNCAKDLK